VKGESQVKGFETQSHVHNFSFGAAMTASGHTGTGFGSGKAEIGDFNITKQMDSASPTLFQACVSGMHYATVIVTLQKAGGTSALKFMTYTFTNAYISSISWSGASGADDVVMEHIAVSFGQVQLDYQPQDNKGAAAGGVIHAGWNIQTNTAA
jgi:type VI secretion system secreted protein Hcp